MGNFKIIQRIFCIEQEKIASAISAYPKAFSGGVAVVTFNGIYVDNADIKDYGTYCSFFEKMKETGVDVQVNFSSTIGHTDRLLPVSYPTMVDYDGGNCKASACPRSAEFLDDIVRKARKYALLKPSIFWIDDDFRASHHPPVKFGCFCDSCVQAFNVEQGFDFSRETLVDSILKNRQVNGKSVREKWQKFTSQSLLNLAKRICDEVHAVDENIAIGYMRTNPDGLLYERLPYQELLDLSKNAKGEVWIRHGSGFYTDKQPYLAVEKNLAIARSREFIQGENVKVIHVSEEVTSPYIRRTKSKKLTVLEAVMNIGIGGLDGITDEAIKPNLDEQISAGSILSWMQEKAEYFSLLKTLIANKNQVGVYAYYPQDLWQCNDSVSRLEEMRDLNGNAWINLFYLGVPFTFEKDNADVVLFSGKTVRAMPQAELKTWLSKGAYMDGTTAVEINRLLQENAVGVKESSYGETQIAGAGTSEVFLPHSLNGKYADYQRYNIWGGSKIGFACLETDGAQALSYSMNEKESSAKLIGSAVYENAYGGRNAVMARGPWCDDVLGQAKGEQIKNVIDWLYKGKAPSRIDSPCRIGQSVWEDGKERVIFLYNTDFDDAYGVRLIQDGAYFAELLQTDGSWTPIEGNTEFIIEKIPAWETVVLKLTRR